MFTHLLIYLIFTTFRLHLCSWSMSSSAAGQRRCGEVEPDWS